MLRIISLKTCRDTNLLYCAASKGYMNASITRFRHCAQITAAVMQSCKLDYLSWIKARIEERINQLSDLTINLVCALPHTHTPPPHCDFFWWFDSVESDVSVQTAAWLAVENKGKTEQNVPFWGDSKVTFMFQPALRVTEPVLQGSVNSSSQQNTGARAHSFPCGAKKMFCSATSASNKSCKQWATEQTESLQTIIVRSPWGGHSQSTSYGVCF